MLAKTLVLPIVCLLLLSACGDDKQLRPLHPNTVIVAFGDSLTFGTGASSDQSYPAQLARLINHQVVNAGIPGETSAAGAARLAEVLKAHQASLLILCHGGNDFLKRAPRDTTRRNLRMMIEVARAHQADVVLLATPSPGLLLPVPEFYAELAEEFRLPYAADIVAEVISTPRLKSDVVHPNAEATAILRRRSPIYCADTALSDGGVCTTWSRK